MGTAVAAVQLIARAELRFLVFVPNGAEVYAVGIVGILFACVCVLVANARHGVYDDIIVA